MENKGYTCSCCGEYHDELPISYEVFAPAYYEFASSEERIQNFELSEDLCIMDNEHYFIRGCVEIPIVETDQQFTWNIWVSLSEENFKKAKEHRHSSGFLEPMFGWFSTVLPCYSDTLNLKASVHYRQNGVRPSIELEPTNHQLAVEMQEGMTIKRVQEIAEEYCENKKSKPWSFEDPENVAVITLKRIIKQESPVLYVVHDEDDGMWQFLDGNEVDEEESCLLSLIQMVNLDNSLALLYDLPLGWVAWRDNQESVWLRSPV